MEKIFDIAKDSEKSWGVIAQGIDENFDDTAKFILADRIPCGDNLITHQQNYLKVGVMKMVYILI